MNAQCKRVIDYITVNGSITQIQALDDISVMRLASRISDLKKEGYPIQTKMIKVRNKYNEINHIAKYSFAEIN